MRILIVIALLILMTLLFMRHTLLPRQQPKHRDPVFLDDQDDFFNEPVKYSGEWLVNSGETLV
jgi:hypothetical protein